VSVRLFHTFIGAHGRAAVIDPDNWTSTAWAHFIVGVAHNIVYSSNGMAAPLKTSKSFATLLTFLEFAHIGKKRHVGSNTNFAYPFTSEKAYETANGRNVDTEVLSETPTLSHPQRRNFDIIPIFIRLFIFLQELEHEGMACALVTNIALGAECLARYTDLSHAGQLSLADNVDYRTKP